MSKKFEPLVFVKGMAMGAADVVPGVSGGTIAFITGIYVRLLSALKSCTPHNFLALVTGFSNGRSREVWQRIDGTFLVTLFAGVLTSVFSLARVITYCLDNYPLLVWSFFFGLVCASIIYIYKQLTHWGWQQWLAVVIGAAIAIVISLLRPAELPNEWWMLTIAGSIAICAMILPGISGSFILLMMGMYTTVMEAIKEVKLLFLMSFAGGCLVGLLCFSHVLSWLLKHFYNTVMALLMGFLIGSLNILWPWQEVLVEILNHRGELVPIVKRSILPSTYEAVTGVSAQLGLCLLSAVIGCALVLLLERVGTRK